MSVVCLFLCFVVVVVVFVVLGVLFRGRRANLKQCHTKSEVNWVIDSFATQICWHFFQPSGTTENLQWPFPRLNYLLKEHHIIYGLI